MNLVSAQQPGHAARVNDACFSLTPAFSRVEPNARAMKPFQRFFSVPTKPLKRLRSLLLFDNTRLKPGVNEMGWSGRCACCLARFLVICFALAISSAFAQEWLDKVDEALFLQSRGGQYRVDFSGRFDLEGYYLDQRPPGLLFSNDDFVNPRLSLFLDARAGKPFYAFVQARVDRGFDPRTKDSDARFDEYLLRYTPFNDARLNLQIGKF